jgi:hypothetical protein
LLAVGGCADPQRRDPLQFTVVGIEPLQGEGLELRMVSTALGMLDGKPMDKVTYQLRGKLNGRVFSVARFQSRGEFDLRSATAPSSGQ